MSIEAPTHAGAGMALQSTPAARRARAALARQARSPFSVEEVDVEAPRAGEVRVRLVATGICHTDVVCRDAFPVPMPIVLGHEGAGVVESVGAGVDSVKPGDHVVLSFNSCGACPNCADREPAYCHQFLGMNFAGVRLADGSSPLSQGGERIHGNFFGQSTFATFAVALARNVVRIDPSVPLTLMGPLGCGVLTGAGAVMNSLKVRPGRSIAIFGTGAVGMAAVMAAKAVGASRIVIAELNPARRALALELGASAALDPAAESDMLAAIKAAAGGAGVDYALDTTGVPALANLATDALLPNGVLGLVGFPPPEAQMPMNMMSLFVRGLGVKFIVEGDADPQTFIPRLVDLYKAGRLPLDRIVQTFPFDQINEAMAAAERGTAIKPVVVF